MRCINNNSVVGPIRQFRSTTIRALTIDTARQLGQSDRLGRARKEKGSRLRDSAGRFASGS
jgi:hypothetical protein